MSSRSSVKTPKNEQGIALLVLVIVIVLGFASYSLLGLSVNEVKTDKRAQTQISLKKAKNALIAYAVANWEIKGNLGYLGKLPCPDFNSTSGEGAQDSGCGSAYANGIGYFPWRTLGLDVPKDGDSCLLYAVSPAYKTTPAAALNPDSFGQFQVVDEIGAVLIGDSPENRPVAVVIAPGEPLAGQSRTFDDTTICGSDYATIKNNLGAYLDDDGATNNAALDPSVEDVIDQLVQAYASNSNNDRIAVISYNDIWGQLQPAILSATFNNKMRNLTDALAHCLAEYANDNFSNAGKRSLPWPAPINLSGNEYRNSYSYDDNLDNSNGYAGRLPYQVLNSNSTIGNLLTEASAPYAGFFEYSFCNLLTVTDGTTIDLTDKTGEYWKLWENWKDHFFYVVSNSYSPDNSGIDCALGCVALGATDRAGMVFFSGVKYGADRRYSPPFDSALSSDGFDDKDDASNYLENNNDSNFPDISGDKTYLKVDAATSNDIMFCINKDMSVVECL